MGSIFASEGLRAIASLPDFRNAAFLYTIDNKGKIGLNDMKLCVEEAKEVTLEIEY